MDGWIWFCDEEILLVCNAPRELDWRSQLVKSLGVHYKFHQELEGWEVICKKAAKFQLEGAYCMETSS